MHNAESVIRPRPKDDILVISDATKAIRKMNGYTYTLKENGMPCAGVIAREVMEAIPEAVGSFTSIMVKSLQGPTVDGNELREETRYLNVDASTPHRDGVYLFRSPVKQMIALPRWKRKTQRYVKIWANSRHPDQRLENQVLNWL